MPGYLHCCMLISSFERVDVAREVNQSEVAVENSNGINDVSALFKVDLALICSSILLKFFFY